MTPPPLALPSGRAVALEVRGGAETLTVTSPGGALELTVTFGPDGAATVRLGAGRVELSAGEVALTCGSLDLRAAGAVTVDADEFRVRTAKSVHLNGETVRLNCPPSEDEGVTGLRPG